DPESSSGRRFLKQNRHCEANFSLDEAIYPVFSWGCTKRIVMLTCSAAESYGVNLVQHLFR
ncbi:hypothetical protein, partial [Pedobacter psychrotolerans]|uniref:hypothetical protein n=1 Tax=Pedobacter psychrotolerans TaxID=1843235 RepID=UPI001AD7F56E